MAITETDIKLLKSARMTDTPDGGGRMTGNVVQSGVDNEIHDDVSNLDRVYGNVSLRKVFGAVLTNDTDKYLGARVFIDKPPADPYIHGLIFDASSLFDTRSQTSVRVESYLAPGAFYQGRLYGNHLSGMSTVMLIQQEDVQIPVVGQVLLLIKNEGLTTEFTQYVKLTTVESAMQTFTDADDTFQRRVVTCSISDSLRDGFPGFQATRTDVGLDYTGKTRVFDTVVADASQYYGIRPLGTVAATGDFRVKADTTYSPLLPSAQIETPLAAVTASGRLAAPEPLGAAPIVFQSSNPFNPAQQLFIGGSVARESLSITWGGTSPLVDDGTGSLTINGVAVGVIDYANGILTMSSSAYPDLNSSTKTITYQVAALPTLALQSTGIMVTLASRSQTYVKTLPSKPGRGTTTVSYLVAGRWYVLRDDGTGALRGANSGEGAGTVLFDTSTVSVTLGALPDVGSQVIIQYGNGFAAVPVSAADPSELPRGARLFADIAPASGVLARGLVTVTWNDGSAKSATCTNGVSSGDGVFYAPDSVLAFSPDNIPASGTTFTVTGSATTPAAAYVADSNNFSFGTVVVPGTAHIPGVSVNLTWALTPISGTDSSFQYSSAGGLLLSEDRRSLGQLITGEVRDNGNGSLVFSGTSFFGSVSLVVGTINYTTGACVFPMTTVGSDDLPGPQIWHRQVGASNGTMVKWSTFPQANRSLTFSFQARAGLVQWVQVSDASASYTVAPTTYKLQLPPIQSGIAVSGLTFSLGTTHYKQTGPSQVVRDVNPTTGVGVAAGSITGEFVDVTSWLAGSVSTLTALAFGGVAPVDAPQSQNASYEITFRTASSPLRPGSFSVQGSYSSGSSFNVTADENGHIVGDMGPSNRFVVRGIVDYQTGVCTLTAMDTHDYIDWPPYDAAPDSVKQALGPLDYHPWTIRTDTLQYSAVAYTYLPLDASILGLDPVRLPSDGRVPVFKAGRVVVVHNTQSLAPQTVSNGQTVNVGRDRLARLRVIGNDGLEVTTGFTKSLDAGTVTFTNVAGMSQPVTIEHRVEDEALCAEAQITGDLRLTRPVTHDYPLEGSYISSAMVVGTLQAASQDGFSQETWTNVWSDAAIGAPILAQYDDTTYPLTVTNAGAISERWAIIFTSSTTFNLVGEQVGQIITGSTASPLSPVNPATGVAYFALSASGWGSGWVAGNVYRFNTVGANFPLWVARTVLQSPTAPPGTDQMTISIRGDIDQ